MRIAFLHPGKAILPEIEAYRLFFQSKGYDVVVATNNEYHYDADIEWVFMGTHRSRRRSALLIHEYASSSVPPFSNAKNRIKKLFNTRPDARIFLNDHVRSQFNFNDNVPHFLRDMGVYSLPTVHERPLRKTFDFVFAGTIQNDSDTTKLLKMFVDGALKGHSLLLAGNSDARIANKFSGTPNIYFAGLLRPPELYAQLANANYGLNFRKASPPFDKQTSSKILDYLACGVRIITTPTAWATEFEKTSGSRFFYLNDDWSNLSWEQLERFDFVNGSLDGREWNQLITGSGILKFIEKHFAIQSAKGMSSV
jgi:hypothetical protein